MKKKMNSGFSFLEVVVSMLILSIVVPGAFAMIVTAQRQLNGARNRYQAYCQAETVLERLRWYVSSDTNPTALNYGPDSITGGEAGGPATDVGVFTTTIPTAPHNPTEVGLPLNPTISAFISGTPTWEYESEFSVPANMRMITVHVSWGEL